ncbi:MAG: glycosyltransferase family 39 protein [bacterium]|nr:glycosyltransferase family 39 protein [bacterium]
MGKKRWIIEILFLLIITVPSFWILLNNHYFSMHDDQHIARLFLLDQGIRQGYWFPRWVDTLGFGYGYPLFNFYPPLIYYIAELFHLAGFSFIWSIKMLVIFGYVAGSLGIYGFVKSVLNKSSAILGAALYTYFFYHSITSYVRGALAEFFAITVLAYVFWQLYRLWKNPNVFNAILFGIVYGLLILTHPLIAFPALIFIGIATMVYFFFTLKRRILFVLYVGLGMCISFVLSAFFWIPSMFERRFTLIDRILTGELADYKLHYIYPQQLWYSPWGYGGSTPGLGDGITFQLGKLHIVFVFIACVAAIVYFLKRKKVDLPLQFFILNFFLFSVSISLSLGYSSFVWDNIHYLAYIQFPWRMLTFTNIFIALVGTSGVYFIGQLITPQYKRNVVVLVLSIVLSLVVVYRYSPYFRPQQLISTSDEQRTAYDEIAWRVSSTSYEFVPKEASTKKTAYGTTTLAIERKDIPKSSFEIPFGKATVKEHKILFGLKEYEVDVAGQALFQLNTYYFPGWKVYIDGVETNVGYTNRLHLMQVPLSSGRHTLVFVFSNTPVRNIADGISVMGFLGIILFLGVRYFFRNS